MKSLLLSILVLALLIAPVASIRAQDDPDKAAREAAIVHINQAIPGIGRPDSWEWASIGLVSNTALNCPLATGTALANPVTVLKITLFYDATTYLYHVSSDGAIVVPCDSKIPGSGGGTPTLATCTFSGATTVTVYQSPVRSATVLGTLGSLFPGAATYTATGRNATTDWLMVTYGGGIQVGWVGVSDISNLQGDCNALPNTDSVVVSGTCTLTATRANIRQAPSAESLILGEIQTGTVVNVIGRNADSSWWQILGGGWVANSVVTTSGTGCTALPITGVTTIDYGDCPPDYLGYRPSRLTVGDQAMVEADSTVPNRVRSKPSISADILFQLQAGDTFDIVDGPQCGNQIVWWFIEADGRFGWTAESEANTTDYFIDPVETVVSAAQFPCPVGYAGYIAPRLGVGQSARVASNITTGINLYQRPSILSQSNALLSAGTTLPALSDGPACNEGLVWWSTTINGVSGWVPESNASVGIYYLEPTTAVPTAQGAINPTNVTRLNITKTLPAFVHDTSRLAWSPDGTLLAVSTVEGLKIYSYQSLLPNPELNAALALPTTSNQVTAFAFDPGGRFLAIGFADGKVQLFNLNTAAINVLASDNTQPITALDFAASNQLLATTQARDANVLSTDFALRTWTFDPATGNTVQVLNLAALTTLPYVNGVFGNDGTIAALSPLTLQAYQASGFVQSVNRAGNSPVLLAADPAWFGGESWVLFGNLTGIQGFNTATGATSPNVVAAQTETATALAADQTPPVAGQTPLLAVAFSDLASATNTVDFFSSAGNTRLHSISVDGARALAFSPDGRVLAVLGATGVQFWTAP